MKTQRHSSAFSKMFLVTPTVYEKLLTCLDEKDKRVTEEMNVEKDIAVEERPGEKYIGMLNKAELDPSIAQTQIPTEMQPEMFAEKQIIQPETIEPEILEETAQLPIVENVIKPSHFIAPKGAFTCNVCLKTFDRSWGLKRHMSTVHKNLQQMGSQQMLTPANIGQEITQQIPQGQLIRVKKAAVTQPAFIPQENVVYTDDDDMPLAELRRRIKAKRMQNVIPQGDIIMEGNDNPLKQPCSLQSTESGRVIPEQIIYKPKTKVIMPSILKRKNVGVRQNVSIPSKKQLFMPSIVKSNVEPSTSFQDWGEKKSRARTSSQAKFPNKPAKFRPGDQDFASWQ